LDSRELLRFNIEEEDDVVDPGSTSTGWRGTIGAGLAAREEVEVGFSVAAAADESICCDSFTEFFGWFFRMIAKLFRYLEFSSGGSAVTGVVDALDCLTGVDTFLSDEVDGDTVEGDTAR
jgi:hypothetical protein